MIDIPSLIKYRESAEASLGNLKGLHFNHFGIQAQDSNDYARLLKEAGGAKTEIFFGGRHTATVVTSAGLVEIYEPKPGSNTTATHIDHVAYICSKLESARTTYKRQIATVFDVGSTHGFKVKLSSDVVIEFRNNDILDSVKDFG